MKLYASSLFAGTARERGGCHPFAGKGYPRC
jgi:hypothetical protein